MLDHGKHRRATLRGRKNLTKRQLAAAFTHNLSVLMRHLTGHGTPKQWLAAGAGALFGVIAALWAKLERLVTGWTRRLRRYRFNQPGIAGIVVRVASRLDFTGDSEIRRFSTGCQGKGSVPLGGNSTGHRVDRSRRLTAAACEQAPRAKTEQGEAAWLGNHGR